MTLSRYEIRRRRRALARVVVIVCAVLALVVISTLRFGDPAMPRCPTTPTTAPMAEDCYQP